MSGYNHWSFEEDVMTDLHAIVGAGPLGRALATELARQGERVRLVSRSGTAAHDGIESVRADATDAAQLGRALGGAAVVYQCAQPAYTRWAQEFPQLQNGILEAAARAGADLVIADNLYMYGDPAGATITEATPEIPVTKKGRVRKRMADAALDAHRAGRLRVAISRPSNYFGPGHDQTSKALFTSALRGRRMQFFGTLDVPHSLSYFPDAARAMAAMATSDIAWGSAWIPPVQPAMTQREFAGRVWQAAGNTTPPRLGVLAPRMLAAVGLFVPVVRELPEMAYEYERPFVVDSSRFEAAFGFGPTPLADAIGATIDAYSGGLVVKA
jgi:nucleoside-diphosphate-sugar epimerase